MTTANQQITARGPRDGAEAAAVAIDADEATSACAYSILEEDEAQDLWRIDAYPVDDVEAGALRGVLDRFPSLRVEQRPLADADWLALALSGLPPVRAGRFFVHGVHDRGRVPANSVALRIEAGAAFGTGHHGTTLGCLLELDRLLKRGRFPRVLDVGTGTGVLAIAACRTGGRRVVGTDIDPVSVRIARENAGINRARAHFVRASDLQARPVRAAAPYDLIFANILPGPLVRLAPEIGGTLRTGGIAIVSGLLRRHERRVIAAYRAHGLRLRRRSRREAWSTLTLERR